LISANFISLGLGLFINIYMARYLDAGNFGVINAALNLATLFTIVTDLGLSKYLTIEVSRKPGEVKPYLNSALLMKLVLVSLAYAGILAFAFFSGYTGDRLMVILIIGLYVLTTAVTQIFQAILQAFQSMEHIAICQLINPVILLAGITFAIGSGLGVIAFAATYLVSGIVILLYTSVVLYTFYLRDIPKVSLTLWKPLLIGGLPLSMSGLFYFLYYKIDIQLIDIMIGSEAVGYYTAAYKLIEAIIFIPYMYAMAVFPLISLYFHSNDSKLHLLFRQSIKYLYLLGLPIVIGTYILADQFIFLCYQDKFMGSIEVLRALSLGLLIIFVNVIPGDMLVGTNMRNASMVINGVAAAANISLNIMILPVYGILGSAYVMVITQGLLFLLNMYLLKKAGYMLADTVGLSKVTLCGIIMGVFVYLAHGNNLLLIMIISAIIYFVSIFLTRSLSRDDMSMISQIFPWLSKIPMLSGIKD
jgi:O-antigen/teichoic acid export membrane protein